VKSNSTFFSDYLKSMVLKEYQRAQKRLILLDYDGTIVPFAMKPDCAKPDRELLKLLERLCSINKNTVCIISGRNSDWLDEQVGHISLCMIAEHGGKIKWKKDEWKYQLLAEAAWKEEIMKVMTSYTLTCADSFVEEKEFSIVWHYRNAEMETAKLISAKLYEELSKYVNNSDIQVMRGNKIIEVRTKGIGKGLIVEKILSQHSYDFILAMGDDSTDEDMFKMLAQENNSHTVKIGKEASFAKYNLPTQQMAISFLENISSLGR
jgi:trehalose 6-phosphate synthase/phosphatase